VQLSIYRSVVHNTYPDEEMAYCYAFQPIGAEEQCCGGRLMGWTSESGREPFAGIEIPDGCQVAHTEDGWQLMVPDNPCAIDAEVVYELALDHTFGLSVIQGPPLHMTGHESR